jgi:2-C-methyl-D-erythritol 4-phosphate cytidylyltransferase
MASLVDALDAAEPSARVVIMEADRPFLSGRTAQLLEAAGDAPASAVAVAVSDTYKEVRARLVTRTVPRETLVEVQGPWVFERLRLEEAIGRIRGEGRSCSSPLDLCRMAAIPVRLLPGDPRNILVRTAEDAEFVRRAWPQPR